ncbi:SGNH/GDSL hydrolase family protein [Noviherbaspirillum cavernae]|uniref:SGNH/GDSL hydrolase family protein n=1 Tax=Noviherbaspirillum cavernae TaxID=2320862 RepID=A0A418WVQ6_9BURK|nr:SGNH/GDSL hydrolase family protein [Noviherbaspirillum cavernae]RJF96733.1 SGNH/GDSL hydrolase family protein [Noviherbaspirillum cavernae]
MIVRLLFLSLALLVSTVAQTAPAELPPMRILFIGNSYTYYNDMPQLLARLASVSGVARPVQAETIAVGGASLKSHWDKGQAQAVIGRGKWDYVVLQEHSLLPLREPTATRHAIRLFHERIKAAGAKTILYLTWARAHAPQTQAELNRAYDSIGKEPGISVAPVGPAWLFARKADPGIPLYESDDSHPSILGSYLAAYVFHVVLFGQAPQRLMAPGGLSGEEHAALLAAAVKAVADTGALQRRERTLLKREGDAIGLASHGSH